MKLRTPAAALIGLGLGASISLVPDLYEGGTAEAAADPVVALSDGGPAALSYDPSISLAPLVDANGPAVVNIEVAQKVAVGDELAPFRHFFDELPESMRPPGLDEGSDGDGYRLRRGAGSGFIISADGYLLTNNHVVDGADELIVRLGDERELSARVVGTDPRTDIALVKIEADEALPWVRLGRSERLRVGDHVVAIGNPFGLSHTVTSGIVSAKGRVIGAGPYDDFIQTDASINPGNSGGPLFNLAGEVVGINTAINPMGQGIGFAVPIDIVQDIVDELKATGTVSRGWIGVGLQSLDADLAAQLGVEPHSGVVIGQVYPGTPAADAGLEPGDVVTTLDGDPVSESEALVRAVGAAKPGDTIKLSLLRDGKRKRLDVTLGARPDEQALRAGRWSSGPEEAAPEQPPAGASRYGFIVRELPSATSRGGTAVTVTEVRAGSPAAAQLEPGDVILKAGGDTVRSVTDLRDAASAAADALVLVVEREGTRLLVTLSGSSAGE